MPWKIYEMTHTILKAGEIPDWAVADLEKTFTILELPKASEEAAAFLERNGARVEGVALRKTKITEAFLSAVPNLKIISSYSAGLDNVDLDAVKRHRVRIENTSHVLAGDVANMAIGLALALTRNVVDGDRFVREGRWPAQKQFRVGRSISHMQVGIVGLGTIGSTVARRLAAFGSKVAYYDVTPKDVDHLYYTDVEKMAAESDMLILTCPLLPSTRHLVGTKVLEALGPNGFLVNISRGPVVEEEALLAALAGNKIAGAALDVFEHEPVVPEAFISDRRLVLTPHMGSATEETRRGMAESMVEALVDFFESGKQEARPSS